MLHHGQRVEQLGIVRHVTYTIYFMPARSIGTATISFGLVSIPTKLYTTNESAGDIHFNMLHEADGARLKQQYICTKCNEVVDREHTVKGYEHAKGQYVVFSAEELTALGLPPYRPGTAVDGAVAQTDHPQYRELSAADLPGVRALHLEAKIGGCVEEHPVVSLRTRARAGPGRRHASRRSRRISRASCFARCPGC